MSQPLEYDSRISNEPAANNAKRLLLAGFFAILATGVGFAIRGGILANWAHDYGFTGGQLGRIGGAGLTGFCFGVIIGGLVADKIGYGSLVVAAFLLHILSAVVSLAVPATASTEVGYQYLYWGTFIFAIANGTLESVANPLIATLFPHNRTHYLNILHASWPAGLVLGGAMGWLLGDMMHIGWKIQLSLFLIPTVLYGVLFFGQKMPKSEAAEKGLSFSTMFKDVGMLGALVACFLLALFFSGGVLQPLLVKPDASPADIQHATHLSQWIGYGIGGVLLIAVAIITNFSIGAWLLFVLFATHALVGAVELGTDGWIQNITGNILTPAQGKILFVWTSAVMFGLRFCANFIEKRLKLSPIGLLMVCSAVASVGLYLVSGINGFFVAMAALTVYAGGKTFFWPTMLAVASDRFPKTGAIAISIMGGIGMMSAGMIGAPGLGYAKDRFTTEHLQQTTAGKIAYQHNKAENPGGFLFFSDVTGLAGDKLETAKNVVNDADAAKAAGKPVKVEPTTEQRELVAANQAGDRMTLKADAAIPATMCGIYILLFLYFAATGGYKAVHIVGTHGAEH
jgi:MFS family permease